MRRLLILACSQTKRAASSGALPFAELYDGPTWRQVRASGIDRDQVAAISAEHGFLEPGRAIATYDRKMDDARVAELASDAGQVARLVDGIRQAGGAFVVGGATYRRLVEAAIALEPELAELVTFATGSYLQLRKQLGAFLREATA